MIRSRAVQTLTVLALILACTAAARPQATTSLNGRVTDKTGAVIPGAAVRLILQATGAIRENTTDGSGQYQFSQLAPDHSCPRQRFCESAQLISEDIGIFLHR